jgi:hypothetical protein
MGPRLKIVNKKYESDFNFYAWSAPNPNHEILAILPNGDQQSFSLSNKLQDYHERYEKFLQSLIVQKINTCELISTCEGQACFILLDLANQQADLNNYTLPKQNPHEARAVFKVDDPDFDLAL